MSGPGAEAAIFVAIEGIDGSGKSTQAELLSAWLEREGYPTLRTGEPSELEVGRLLRQALRRETPHRFGADTVALLFAADRVEHVRHQIAPALAAGTSVVSDRYLGSSLAFQPTDAAGQFETTWVADLNRFARAPDLTLLVDVPVAVALERIEARGEARERFEVASTLREVARRYAALVSAPPAGLGPVAVVSGVGTPEAVAQRVIGAVAPLLNGDLRRTRGGRDT